MGYNPCVRPFPKTIVALAFCALAGTSCAGGGTTPNAGANASRALPGWGAPAAAKATPTPTPKPTPTPVRSACAPGIAPTAPPGSIPVAASGLRVPAGFTMDVIANVGSARELAVLPDGDLLVGTEGATIYIVPNAEAAGAAGKPAAFATVSDSPNAGVAFAPAVCKVFFSTQYGVYATPYKTGDRVAERVAKIAAVRTGAIAPHSDGDVHRSTSVAFTGNVLYASVGSSCNACVEVDPTRASIQEMTESGTGMRTRATRMRNAIALTVDPATGHLWAGGAGQDSLPTYHPYEYFDDVTSHAGIADYGWPECEENRVAYTKGANCASTVQPLLVLPAYSTIVGATFYPAAQTGTYAFPAAYLGGVFLAAHGSWHTPGGCNVPPRVAFFPMRGGLPRTPVNWGNPNAQWTQFVGGFQPGCAGSTRIGRPTGIAVGPKGSLFLADDQTGNIYRIRR